MREPNTIVTIGEIVVEIMATTNGDGFLEAQSLVGPFPSGAPAIFIDQVARLGHPCGMVSCVGDDDFGRLNIDRLARDGVDTTAIAIDPEAATGSAFVRYRSDGSRDFVFNIKHSASGRIGLTPEALALIGRAGHLHVMGSSLFAPALFTATDEAIDVVRRNGGTVSFDPNVRKELLALPGMREALQSIFERCDLFLPSGSELTLFTTARDEIGAVSEIMARGVRAIVLKQGAAGAVYFDAATTIRQDGFPAEEIDPTGAGDCFGATFVTAWLRGEPPARALALAAASGSLAVRRQGPMEGASTMAELVALVDQPATLSGDRP